MPIQAIQEFVITDRSTKNYDAIKETIGANHPGLILHTAGFDDQSGVFRIVEPGRRRKTHSGTTRRRSAAGPGDARRTTPLQRRRRASSCTSSTT